MKEKERMSTTEEFSQQLAEFAEMTSGQLKSEYVRLFGEPPRSHHKRQLIRRIAWRLQVQAEGDIGRQARKRAGQLADLSWLRLTAPPSWEPSPTKRTTRPRDQRLPAAGTILKRTYKGHVVEVQILDRGFEYQGQHYRSLSAVARAVTGGHWNGFLFFGLTHLSNGETT
jgi:hypothetical protein